MKAIVAMNDAVGLRFMHHEDVAVGMWVSGLDIRHIRQSDDHGPRVAYIGASSPEELMVYCMRLWQACMCLVMEDECAWAFMWPVTTIGVPLSHMHKTRCAHKEAYHQASTLNRSL